MTAEEVTALKNKISDAEAQYHKLMLGQTARVIVDQNGERVEFNSANRSHLYTYIQQLKAQLPDEYVFQPVKPIRFLF